MVDDVIAKASVALGVDKDAFLREIGSVADLGGKQMGEGLGKALKEFAPVAIVAGLGGALLDIGTKFEDAFNTIQQKTGATGQALKGLEGDFKSVLATTPGATFGNVADAISEVSVRTHLTGSALDDLTSKFVELGKITKTDVAANVQGMTALFNNFGVAAGNQSGELDVLFKASQQAGVGIDALTQNIQAAAPVAQTLGLNLNQTTALVAQLTQAGLPATKVMMGLGMEFAKAAKAGKDPTTVISAMVAQIKAAPTATAAATIAIKDFGIGARQAATLVDAVRAGTLNFGATLASITNGQGGITATADATLTLGDRFKIFKNEALVALEPIAMKALEFANVIGADLPGAFKSLEAASQPVFDAISADGPPTLAAISDALTTVRDVVQTDVLPALQALGNYFSTQIVPVVQSVADFFSNTFGPAIQSVASRFDEMKTIVTAAVTVVAAVIYVAFLAIQAFWETFHATILRVLTATWDEVKLVIETAVKLVTDIINLALDLLTGHWSKAWHDLLDALNAVWTLIGGTVSNGLSIIGNLFAGLGGVILRAVADLPGIMLQLGKDLFTAILNGIGDVGTAMSDVLTSGVKLAVNGVIDVINGMINFVDNLSISLPSVKVPGIGTIGGGSIGMPIKLPDLPHLASGGIVPGSPSGTLLVAGEQNRSEAIVPLTDAMRANLVNAASAVAPGPAATTQSPVPIQIENLNVTNTEPERLATDLITELRLQAFLAGVG